MKEITIDGNRFSDIEGFYMEINIQSILKEV